MTDDPNNCKAALGRGTRFNAHYRSDGGQSIGTSAESQHLFHAAMGRATAFLLVEIDVPAPWLSVDNGPVALARKMRAYDERSAVGLDDKVMS